MCPEHLPFQLQSAAFRADTADYTISSILNRREIFMARQMRKQGKAEVEKLLEQTRERVWGFRTGVHILD